MRRRIVILLSCLSSLTVTARPSTNALARLSEDMESGRRVIAVVESCLADPNCSWSESFQDEYIKTIGRVLARHRAVPDVRAKLDVLQEGFVVYWDYISKATDPFGLELSKAEIQWYVEDLMSRKLLSEEDKRQVRSQCRELLTYAAGSIQGQFVFLDPNVLSEAMEEELAKCDALIKAPILPILSRQFTQEEMSQIKTNWDRSYSQRSGTWQMYRYSLLGPVEAYAGHNCDELPQKCFAGRCMAMLVREIWHVTAEAPEYVSELQRRRQHNIGEERDRAMQVYAAERRLLGGATNQFEQIEQWSFVLAVLLSTYPGEFGPPCTD